MSKSEKIFSMVLAGTVFFACGAIYNRHTEKSRNDGYKFVIGMSQANLNDPWRIAMDDEIFQEAQKYSNIKVVFRDGGGDTEKQANVSRIPICAKWCIKSATVWKLIYSR